MGDWQYKDSLKGMEIRLKIAVLSDIHSNHIALQACMEKIKSQQADGVILAGDYVSDCPDPQRTLALIRQLEQQYTVWKVKGNREEYFVSHKDGFEDGWSYSTYKGSLLYTYERLKEKDIEWFRSMPVTERIEIKGTKPIRLVHGSVESTRELLYPQAENTKRYMEQIEEELLIGGHTHLQCIYEYKNKTYLNPGSVGVAIGVSKAAHMAFLCWEEKKEKWEFEFLTVPYNYEELKRQFEQSDIMEKAKLWPVLILKSIECGMNVGPLCAKGAMDMANRDHDPMIQHTIPEKYWLMSAKKLGIIKAI